MILHKTWIIIAINTNSHWVPTGKIVMRLIFTYTDQAPLVQRQLGKELPI